MKLYNMHIYIMSIFFYLCVIHSYRIPNNFADYPILILPGFGNNDVDYINPNNQGEKYGLKYCLESKGFKYVEVLPLKRISWLNIAKGLITSSYWNYKSKPELLFKFYYDAVEKKVANIRQVSNKPIIIIGHSAGGWLARGIIANEVWNTDSFKKINAIATSNNIPNPKVIFGLITLGTPHFPPRILTADMTHGALAYINDNFPGAYFQKIAYVTIGSSAIYGNSSAPKGIEKFAAQSYFKVTGNIENNGNEVGDGLVPLSSAHLNGALQITLNNAWHSINAPNNMWYGNPDIIDIWLPKAINHLQKYS